MLARDSVVTYGDIFKRTSSLNPVNSKHKEISNNTLSFIESISPETVTRNNILRDDCRLTINRFMECLCELENANSYYEYPLMIIDKINKIDENYANTILSSYIATVMPYINNQEAIKETLDLYNNINTKQKSLINSAASKYIAADRITKNHMSISKRFNIEEKVKEFPKLKLDGVVDKICEMVDTYDIRPYQKLNLCIEETSFLLDRNGIKYSKSDMVRHIVEFFLLNYPDSSVKDMNDFKLALDKNYCLTESDTDKVDFLYSDDDYNNEYSINNSIESYLKASNKTASMFSITILSPISDNNTIEDISYNIGKLIKFILDSYLYTSEEFGQEWFLEAIRMWADKFVNRIKDTIYNNTKSDDTKFDLDKLINDIQFSINSFSAMHANDIENDITTRKIVDTLSGIVDDLNALKEIPYSDYNLECMEFVNSNQTTEILYEKVKILSKKPRNILRAVMKIDSTLRDKGNAIVKDIRNKSKKLGDYLWGVEDDEDTKPVSSEINNNITEDTIVDYIGNDGRFDKVVFRDLIDDSAPIIDVHDKLTTLCKILNAELEAANNYTAKCYYVINEPIMEIHFKESTILELPEDVNLESIHNPDMDYYTQLLTEMKYFGNIVTDEFIANVHSRLDNITSCQDKELLSTIFEAVSIIDNFQDDDDSKQNTVEYPYWAQCEAYMCLDSLLAMLEANPTHIVDDEDDDAPEDDDEDNTNNDKDKGDKKNPFKGIDLGGIKLMLQGIKGKFKGMSQKEKEVSKKVDNSFKLLVKNMKNALISDRREALVKGSVIPSFSKCIKIGIALAGVAKFFDPGAAAIAALGGFAASKILTEKERKMMIDEIEVELEALEKEISMAESDGKMKKYRALMMQKKKLQREYQRIKYNLKVPLADSGTKRPEE